jgi:E3 ubiquitin-protein ligase BRE1
VKQLKEECLSIRKEKEQVECLLAQSKENINSITKDLDTARARCDELVSESNVKEDERKRVYESLAVVKRESEVAIMKAAASSNGISSGNIGGGTASEGLNAQVKYLSNKVHCPVCNVRDKNCILLRCRHMFCHQCVDVTVKNRSRKCPACAQRFDMKDVAEIWL